MSKRKKALTEEEALELLRKSRQFAIAVLRYCQQNKQARIHDIWLVSLLASSNASARSIQLLIKNRQYWDAKLIARAIHDAYIDIFYILHDPCEIDHLVRLWYLEAEYDTLYELRNIRDVLANKQTDPKLRKFKQTNLQRIQEQEQDVKKARAVAERYKNISRIVTRKTIINPKAFVRWMDISLDDKKDAIIKSGVNLPTKLVEYSLRALGNAAAHRRPHMLKDFWLPLSEEKRQRLYSVRYFARPRLRTDYQLISLLIIGPFSCLLAAAWRLTEWYFLPEEYERRAQQLFDQWRRSPS